MAAGKMIILLPDGERTETAVKMFPGLGRMQKAVGGYIEKVPLLDTIEIDGERVPCLAFSNEDGRMLGLQTNRQATEAWLAALQSNGNATMFGDDLCGPVVIIVGEDILSSA